MQAAYNGHTKIAQAILSHPNVQVNMQTEVECFCYMHCNINAHLTSGFLIIQLRVTALMMAAYFNHLEIVQLLIARDDIQLNIQDKVGTCRFVHMIKPSPLFIYSCVYKIE